MIYLDNLGKGGYAPEAVSVDTAVPSGQQKVKIEMNVNYLVK